MEYDSDDLKRIKDFIDGLKELCVTTKVDFEEICIYVEDEPMGRINASYLLVVE